MYLQGQVSENMLEKGNLGKQKFTSMHNFLNLLFMINRLKQTEVVPSIVDIFSYLKALPSKNLWGGE